MTNTDINPADMLSIVHAALVEGREDEALAIYRSIPGCADLPLPTAEGLTNAIHLRAQVVATNERISNPQLSNPETDVSTSSRRAMIMCAERDTLQAKILESGGVAEFPGLFRIATGERVTALVIDGKWGKSWMICNPDGSSTGTFLPTGPRSRKLKAAGLEERVETAPARAQLGGRGYGNSGTAWVEVVRLDGGYPGAPAWRVAKAGR